MHHTNTCVYVWRCDNLVFVLTNYTYTLSRSRSKVSERSEFCTAPAGGAWFSHCDSILRVSFWHGLGHGHVAEVKGIWLLALFGGKKAVQRHHAKRALGRIVYKQRRMFGNLSVCLSGGFVLSRSMSVPSNGIHRQWWDTCIHGKVISLKLITPRALQIGTQGRFRARLALMCLLESGTVADSAIPLDRKSRFIDSNPA